MRERVAYVWRDQRAMKQITAGSSVKITAFGSISSADVKEHYSVTGGFSFLSVIFMKFAISKLGMSVGVLHESCLQ
jgi:hypothetical protein